MTGAEPAERAEQPRLGQLHEAGPFGHGLLRLVTEPTRIEWRYEAGESEENEAGLLRPLTDELNQWIPSMSRWLESAPDLTRIAFGGVLVQEVPDKETGYRLLSSMLPAVRLEPASSDFLYRINRPRPSRVDPKVRINRLTTWSVRFVARFGIRILGGRALPPELGPRRHAVRLELDINTPAEYEGPLRKDRLVAWFQELVEFGKEIAEKGDIP